MKKNIQINNLQLVTIAAALSVSNFALAAGGLAEATSEASSIKSWAYGLLGVGVFIYLIYNVVMAMADKKTWGDVISALMYVAAAGGILVAGEWAWSIWGS